MIYDNLRYHCLIVISPPNTVVRDIENIKFDFQLKHGAYEGQGSKAHITLNHEILSGKNIQQLASTIQNRITDLQSFDLLLGKFDFFPDSSTFFVSVRKSNQLMHLQQLVTTELQKFKTTHYNFLPHMTIGKKLSRKQFGEAYYEFEGKSYTEMFRVRDITLLYKPIWEGKYETTYINLESSDWGGIY